MADRPVKYITRSADTGWWVHDASESLAKTVYEDEDKPADTGLLDADGTKIYRVRDRQPIGFITCNRGARNG
jgi:hypothetical protein